MKNHKTSIVQDTPLIISSKNVWIFSSWMGKKIIDNPFAFSSWVQKNKKNIRCIWIVKKKSLVHEEADIYYSLSVKGMFYQLTDRVSICSHSTYSDFNPIIMLFRRSIFKVNLWHGAPLKKIMHDIETGLAQRIKKFLYDRYDLVLSPGPKFSGIFTKAFKVDSCKVIEAKYPRIKAKSIDPSFILYAPTFRDGLDFDYFKNIDFVIINKLMKKLNKVFLIRLHPSLNVSQELKNKVKIFSQIQVDETPDVYRILPYVSVLISDYSGIIFDFLYYERPIIFAPFDLDEYLNKTRGVYFDYAEISIRPICYNWCEIVLCLEDIENYDYEKLRDLMIKYCCTEISPNKEIFERIQNATY